MSRTRLNIFDFNLGANAHGLVSNKENIYKGEFTNDGIYSQKVFGPSDTPTHYMCDCGTESGAFNSGKICKVCGTAVREQNLVSRVGWIDLEKFYIIHPMLYVMVQTLVGKKILDGMIHNVENNIDKQGFVRDTNEKRRPGVNQWANIGFRGLYQNFREIIMFFGERARKNPKKLQAYTVLCENWEKIWINKIPVTSPTLRPATIRDNKVFYDEINNNYTFILNHITQLKKYEALHPSTSVDQKLAQIQLNLMKIFEKTMERLSRKHGFIRREIMGTRINFVNRSVILPAPPTIAINELWVPYLAFMEMWQMPIIHSLTQMHRCDYREAMTRWFMARLVPSPDVYAIINQLVASGCYLLFNRNPTINIGSVLRMKIGKVKEDPTDLTTSTPNNILKMLGGDYDGDTLNLIALFEPWLIEATEKLDPRFMVHDRNHAYRYNSDMLLDRDIVVGLESCG